MQQSFSFETPAPAIEAAPAAKSAPRNLVIEAGAGTGKTTAIVAEVLRLMLESETLAPERVVLVTFTEKAAAEIAERIRAALEELAATGSRSWPCGSATPLVLIDDPEAAARRIERHLANIDALRSQTIHSFCQTLLRLFPIEAGLDPQFKIVQGFERSLLYGQIYDAWVDSELAAGRPVEQHAEWELLFEHVGYLDQVRDIVFALLDRRDLLDEAGYDIGSYDDVAGDLAEAIRVIRSTDAIDGDVHAQQIFDYIREAPPSIETLDASIEYLRPIANAILAANLPRNTVLKEALKTLRSGEKKDSLFDRLSSHRTALALIALTRRFAARLEAEKAKLGLVDFDDLLLWTRMLLEDPVVLARARDMFDHIFVDEFQDTDRTQARILDRLTRDDRGIAVPGRTFVVGDPKQSIYGFRRADPETYYAMTEGLVREGAERRPIREQYRSHPLLVAAINAMFARLFPDETHDPNVFRPPYLSLESRARDCREIDAPVTLIQALHHDRGDRLAAEAEALAAWITARLDGSRDLRRFAILFRRLSKLDVYLEALDRAGIDYVLPPTRQFLDRTAPVDLLAVLRAIAYPFDRGAQISAARSPYFALTDAEIAECATQPDAAPDGRVATSGAPRAWDAFCSAMDRFRETARHETVSGLVDRIIETTGIERVYHAAAGGGKHLVHLEHVRSIAFEYDRRAGGSVRQFVTEIDRRRDDPDEIEPVLLDDSTNAVRIMTAHAAKGLEFDTVILPDLSFPVGNQNAVQFYAVERPRSLVMTGRVETLSANFRKTPDGEILKKVSGLRENAEMRRLFYVGVTRAKSEVAFIVSTHSETKQQGFIKALQDALGLDKAGLAALFGEPGKREFRSLSVGPVAVESFHFEGLATSGTPRLRRRLRDAEIEELARSEPLAPLEIASVVKTAEKLQPAEVASRRGAARARTAGTLLHRVLELWSGSGEFEAILRGVATEAGADRDLVAQVRKRLTTVSRSPHLARIRAAETIGCELPIHVLENGKLVERRIDRLIREKGQEIVIDYKSGGFDARRLENDREQVARYCAAMRAITGRECSGVLWYIDLERDEMVEVAEAPSS